VQRRFSPSTTLGVSPRPYRDGSSMVGRQSFLLGPITGQHGGEPGSKVIQCRLAHRRSKSSRLTRQASGWDTREWLSANASYRAIAWVRQRTRGTGWRILLHPRSTRATAIWNGHCSNPCFTRAFSKPPFRSKPTTADPNFLSESRGSLDGSTVLLVRCPIWRCESARS